MSERVLHNNDEVIGTQPVQLSPDEMVTVASFPDPATASLACAALESANIPVFLQGENANSLLPVAFSAQVQVRPQDERAARAVLDAYEASPESVADVTAAELADEAATRNGGRESA